MKSALRYVSMMLVAVMVSLAMTACGDDDDKGSVGPIDPDHPAVTGDHDLALVGTWQNKDSGSDWSMEDLITFYKNGTWSSTEKYWDEEDGTDNFWAKGYWSTDNGYIYLYCASASDKGEVGDESYGRYSVNGNTLYLDGEEFTRVE